MVGQTLASFLFFGAAFFFAASQAETESIKIKMGSSTSPPALEQITPYLAIEKGIFKKHGLDVEIIQFRGDAINTKALLTGDVDVTIDSGATSVIVSASQGARIRLWMVTEPITPYHFVARKESSTSLQGLVGKAVAVSGVGAISYHIPRIVLERNGVDPDKVNYVAVGSPIDRFKALLAGKVDATLVTNTDAAKLANYPDIIELVNVPKVLPEIPYEFGVAREDYIQKNPDTMNRLAQAIIETNRWIATNKQGTIEVAKKILVDENPDVLSKAYDMTDPRLWGVNGDMAEASYNYTIDFLIKVGYMKAPVPFKEFFDRRFVDRALKALGRK